MLPSYNLVNVKRDLSDVLSDVVANQPRFISLFKKPKAPATNRKHEWLEDQITGRSLTAASVNASTKVVTGSEADVAKVMAGTIFTIKDDSALFRVTSKPDATSFVYVLIAAHGSETANPSNDDILLIVSTPMKEGTGNGDGEQGYNQSGTEYNYLQIFRREIVVTTIAENTKVYGNVDNQITKHTADGLNLIGRDMNRQAIFGTRVLGTETDKGQFGGLYEFGAQGGSLAVNGGGNRLDSFVINDASQAIIAEGGNPNTILCGPGQARVLSNEYKKELTIVRADKVRGAYVAQVVNEVTGKLMTIVVEPDIPDTHTWVLDSEGLFLVPLANDALRDEDATEKGFHGVKRVIIGSYTTEFKNAKQRLCRIYGVQDSDTALAAIKAGSSATS